MFYSILLVLMILVYPNILLSNSVNLINMQVNPSLTLSYLSVQPHVIIFNNTWFNLTHTGGIVVSNMTFYTPTTGQYRITFLIQNITLVNTILKMNSSKPSAVWLNGMLATENATWTYLSNILTVYTYNNFNITLSWISTPSATIIYKGSNVDYSWVLIAIPLMIFFVGMGIKVREKRN